MIHWLRNLLNRNSTKVIDVDRLVRMVGYTKDKTFMIGILEDWSGTADVIFEGGIPVLGAKPHIWSDWGTPCLYIVELDRFIPCWKYGPKQDWSRRV
jgi:hypothetical protein